MSILSRVANDVEGALGINSAPAAKPGGAMMLPKQQLSSLQPMAMKPALPEPTAGATPAPRPELMQAVLNAAPGMHGPSYVQGLLDGHAAATGALQMGTANSAPVNNYQQAGIAPPTSLPAGAVDTIPVRNNLPMYLAQ